ncbi:MAG: 4-hydroxy-tetrahydrodipicolinate synthase, partial [Proteobacteria bacterium]|nr:4-hydroxy-tetrahydrodipicolinate synthase [Pseudomonadota bacterium]
GPGGPLDALALRAAAGDADDLADVCPLRFALPAAPTVAAAAEGREVEVWAIHRAYERLAARHDCIVAEGAGGLLVVTPYYNKPTQEGLYLHFKAVAGATGLPVLIYNIPGRSAVDMTPETMARLYEACQTIIGVKDATGDPERPLRQAALMGKDFLQLSGDDITALEFNQKGGAGCISVSANIAPGLCSEFQNLCLAGDFEEAGKIHQRLTPLHKNLFVETNPVPVKYAAHLLGLCRPDVRLPLAPLGEGSRKIVKSALKDCGLLA